MAEMEVGVVCGQCGTGDVHFEACPVHEWAVGSICHGCHDVYVVGDGRCPECGWPADA